MPAADERPMGPPGIVAMLISDEAVVELGHDAPAAPGLGERKLVDEGARGKASRTRTCAVSAVETVSPMISATCSAPVEAGAARPAQRSMD